ncbi:MAG: 3-deoxy-7-phosphoheptulonate synthase [Calditrichaeota bacterium]|nr:MAG: 3-deoxy-7-phosphoheptulonate synthase [Calditrichota bacterium]
MILELEKNISSENKAKFLSKLFEKDVHFREISFGDRGLIHVQENGDLISLGEFSGVNEVRSSQQFKLASREFKPEDTVVDVGGVKIGGKKLVSIAGPCAVESLERTLEIAKRVQDSGAEILRGGAFKPRTSPYSFQGLQHKGIEILAEVKARTGLKIITEVIDTETIDEVAAVADIFQIGSRNMQNFSLLKKIGKTKKPVLLKRGLAATLDELLLSAEYLLSEGNPNVILCERGIRTFANHTRNTLDLSIIPTVKEVSHLPIIVDPSHGTGKRNQIYDMSLASIASGADGIIVEVHNQPSEALSDGFQAIEPSDFQKLMRDISLIANVRQRHF